MKYLSLFFAIGLLGLTACTDPSLDPLQIADLKKASIIALRGTALDNLFDRDFRGASDRVSKTADPATESYSFDADFLSDDITSIAKVDIFARKSAADARVPVATVPGSDFKPVTGAVYPRASINIPLPTILSALGVTLSSLEVNQYLYIECDLTLTTGEVVAASSIVNSSLFESDAFYPAHNLLYLITE